MDKKLVEVLSENYENHILPFLWVHGESEEETRKYVRAIHDAHIYALCVESRPHPDFVGEKWWTDMGIILDEAKKLGMKVWLLDDAHFPSGYANGRLEKERKELRRIYLDQWHVQVSGYRKNARLRFSDLVREHEGETLLEIIAVRLMPDGGYADPIVITDKAKNGVLYWDIPDGEWRIYYIKETAYAKQDSYINPVDPDSVAMFIDEVYESHYKHFKDYFGNTFAGFFSDEPPLGNPHRSKIYDAKVGEPFTKVPWRKGLLSEIMAAEPRLEVSDLVFLWAEGSSCGDIDYAAKTAQLRYTFMNVITSLYGTHFCKQLGDWCRDHGVEYIGHIIEDNNAHARTGCTAGHYFRSMSGQDMAGMDIVLEQLMPGTNSGYLMGPCNWSENFEWDEEFFHFALAKLASSFAQIDPTKKGRAMCEIFGAFGWGEGLNFMAWMANHTLVNGINNYVPHAFSLREFPDYDCPPTFYGHGQIPQYRYFHCLMDYMNRMSHLLSDGKHISSVAVLYHGEAEWGGKAMLMQKPIRRLTEAHIECDILPTDAFVDCGKFAEKLNIFGGHKATVGEDKKLYMNGASYGTLIIPEAEALPGSLLEWLQDAATKGLPIYFINSRPKYSSTIGAGTPDQMCPRVNIDAIGKVISLDELIVETEALGLRDITVKSEDKAINFLRYYHYMRGDNHFYMFFNSSPNYTLNAEIGIEKVGQLHLYDAYENKLYKSEKLANTTDSFKISLAPQEACLYCINTAGESIADISSDCTVCDDKYVNKNDVVAAKKGYVIKPNNGWQLATAKSLDYPNFADRCVTEELFDFLEVQDDFSGTIRYTTEFDINDATLCDAIKNNTVKNMYLDLGEVYETVEVWLNGEKLGTQISAPYVFKINKGLKTYGNQLIINVTGTMEAEIRDGFSAFITLTPVGLLGDVRIVKLD